MSSREHDSPPDRDSELSVTALFDRLNSVLPTGQEIVSVSPETSAGEALGLFEQHGFSRVPVMVGSQVLGLFSLPSFSQAVIKLGDGEQGKKVDLVNVTVDDCIEVPTFARITNEFRAWFDAIDRQDMALQDPGDEGVGSGMAVRASARTYGIGREDMDYIMETFPIVKQKDEEAFGGCRTMRLVIGEYDHLAQQ